MIRNLIFILGAFVLLFLGLSFIDKDENWGNGQALVVESETLPTVIIGDTAVIVEIADDVFERSRGLSGRESLPENQGMLFVFDNPDFHGIWMKEMFFPIDIVWIGTSNSDNFVQEDKNEDVDTSNNLSKNSETFYIIDVKKDAQPDSYPEVFYPKKSSLYVLEINSGFLDKHNIKIGDEVHF